MAKHNQHSGSAGHRDGGISRRSVLMGAAATLAAAPLLPGLVHAQDKAINMRLSWWGSEDRNKRTLELIKLFEKKNPGVDMTAEYGGLIGYQDKMNTEFAGGNAPDVMQVSGGREQLIASGRLMEFDKYIESGALDLSDANENVLAIQKVGGKLYDIPWGLACGCYFLDTKVFADTKIDLPGLDWNWDKYAEIAKAITKATPDGLYGSADIWAQAGTKAWAPFGFFLRQNGKNAYTEDGQLGFVKDDLTEWFTFWDDLRRAGGVPPASVTALENGFETSPIVTGRAAMYPINSSIASSLQGLAPHTLACVTIPSGINSKALSGPKYGGYINASMLIYANAASKHPDMAMKFDNFVINDPDAAKIQLMARGVPLSS
jgi:multiple sugar transport system substrate-binding protein